MGLIARGLESRGLPTVVVGLMHDIMRLNRPPRGAVLDFPLGHPFGRPHDPEGQKSILRDALRLLESAPRSGTLQQLPYDWGELFTYTPGQRKGPPPGEDE